jgi:hypothetical protein
MSGAIPLPLLYAFMACTVTTVYVKCFPASYIEVDLSSSEIM